MYFNHKLIQPYQGPDDKWYAQNGGGEVGPFDTREGAQYGCCLFACEAELDILFNRMAEVGKLAEDAAYTDGQHHKQWYLIEIARLLGRDTSYYKEEIEPGIAP